MLRELLRRVDMMVILENDLDALVRLRTRPARRDRSVPTQYGIQSNLRPESFIGPNAGLTEVLIPAGYVTTVYDPVFALSPDGTRYVSVPSDTPTELPEPGLPFSLVFRAEPGKEDVLLKIASAYEAASRRRIPPPAWPATDEISCRHALTRMRAGAPMIDGELIEVRVGGRLETVVQGAGMPNPGAIAPTEGRIGPMQGVGEAVAERRHAHFSRQTPRVSAGKGVHVRVYMQAPRAAF